MAVNSDNIKGGFRGDIYLAPKGSVFPVNPVVDPSVDFRHFGWLGDDGITFSRSREVTKEYAMGSITAPVWSQVTSQESGISVVFKETKPEVLSVLYQIDTEDMTSTATSGSGGSLVPKFTTMIESSVTTNRDYAMIIDLTIGDPRDGGFRWRRELPKVQVGETGDLAAVTTASMGYQMSFDALVGTLGGNPVVCKHLISGMEDLPTAAFPGVPSV